MERVFNLLQTFLLAHCLRQFTNYTAANLLKLVCQRDHIIGYFLVRMRMLQGGNYLPLQVCGKNDLQLYFPGFGTFAYFANIRVGTFLGAVSPDAFYIETALAVVPYITGAGFKNSGTHFLCIVHRYIGI